MSEKMNNNSNTMKRTISLLSGVGILVGYVIGASIFVTPGTLASTAGPSVWLAYVIAGLLAFTICFIFSQIGSLCPVSGAIYIFSSLTTTEYGGFLYTLWNSIIFIFGTPLMAITAATYLQVFLPDINISITAMILLVLTFLLNILGNKISGSIQTFAIFFLMAIIVVFAFGGILKADWSHFTPAFPYGFEPIWAGVLSCYYSFTGFNILTEMSGEVKNPNKNLPRIIFLGFAIVMILYVGTCVGMVALVPATDLGVGEPMVYAASKVFNGSWFGTALAIAAICGSWTTLNACFLGLPRSFYQLGKSGLLPKSFAKLNKYGVPIVSLIAFTIIVAISLIFNKGILFLINMTSLFFMLIAILLSIGSLRVKSTMAQEYELAGYKLKGLSYYFWPIITIISTGYFLIDFLVGDIQTLIMTVIVTILGIFVYNLRKKSLKKQGIDMIENMKNVLKES